MEASVDSYQPGDPGAAPDPLHASHTPSRLVPGRLRQRAARATGSELRAELYGLWAIVKLHFPRGGRGPPARPRRSPERRRRARPVSSAWVQSRTPPRRWRDRSTRPDRRSGPARVVEHRARLSRLHGGAPIVALVAVGARWWLPLPLFPIGGVLSAVPGASRLCAVSRWATGPPPTDQAWWVQRTASAAAWWGAEWFSSTGRADSPGAVVCSPGVVVDDDSAFVVKVAGVLSRFLHGRVVRHERRRGEALLPPGGGTANHFPHPTRLPDDSSPTSRRAAPGPGNIGPQGRRHQHRHRHRRL